MAVYPSLTGYHLVRSSLCIVISSLSHCSLLRYEAAVLTGFAVILSLSIEDVINFKYFTYIYAFITYILGLVALELLVKEFGRGITYSHLTYICRQAVISAFLRYGFEGQGVLGKLKAHWICQVWC